VTYAQQIDANNWVGVMPILAVQRFKATGLEPFDNPVASTAPGRVTNKGADTAWGYGLRIGWLGMINEKLTLGVSYQSRLYMEEFDDYAGLFAEQGDFDTPSTWVVGLVYTPINNLDLVVDFQRINYGEVNSLSNPNDVNIFADSSRALGANAGLGFGWDDIDIIKLGAQWTYRPDLILRAGYSHASKLFDSGQALFNVLAPATIRDHVSLGSTIKPNQSSEVNLSLTLALNEKINGNNPVFTPGQTGSVEMEQWEIEVSWSQRF